MQFESDFRFDMDDGFGMQPLPCPSTTNSFSSASSSAYDPFTPTSRRSTPNEIGLDFEGSYPYAPPQSVEMTPPSTMSKFMFGGAHVKTEPEPMSFHESLPTTPMKKIDSFGTSYDQIFDIGLASQASMGTITPSNSFGLHGLSPEAGMGAAAYMMTPTHSMSGSEIADTSSSWSMNNESPISLFPHKDVAFQDMEALDLERHSQSPINNYHVHNAESPNRLRFQRRLIHHEAQRRTSELQRAQIRASRKQREKSETAVDVVRRAMCKCDYPGCHKAFRRNEHLKRHKQTFHGEGPNRFSCEFCGKDQFNRQDNLNNHRKLHARPNSRNRGVEFIPAAVPIIEHEERNRKRRAPPKSKLTEKRSFEF
ncbi:unnamed protein product [Clonostachys rosea f. rosea IK726]|uniref:C2H2-type domain-containing protein n=2 Tax=Bionectria ochroleuca TaxID=29856 RepID=A0A0B7JTZ3_BIOOC|nr:unnamed protein product [Clonostachys rosea f. rosea IK726]